MTKLASYFVAAGLAALLLSGCATPPVSEPAAAAGAGAVLGVDTKQVLPQTPPADASTPGDDEFWEANYAPLGTATAAIEEQFPEEFGYAFFDKTPTMHVAFKGSAPAEAVVLLQNTGLPFVIVESVGFNAAEYQTAANEVTRQTRQYVSAERQVQVSQSSSDVPGLIEVSFQSLDPTLTIDPGLAESIDVDPPFSVAFDATNTSPVTMGVGTEQVLPPIDE
ncbi:MULTISPECIES: hypothetical protein [Cryobacterium]|uniref:Uncharacterized protein n=1 Tax=Cryobacterium zongtaii TaxID=1259217 RepID=A0A2S3ZE00_9MICO|nr:MULTISPECIES: hypothetical protein [Cryobacterium]POH64765.1 hypothetical protein C3B61_11400 [Cryobacterium zongtaii]POH65101.1 hypothetical protein C3B60_12935 [Cryobacterium zongtaii]TFC44726.1 hypothetical protein E3O57_10265 [Cryobacterium sp. TMN-39-2]